MSRSGLLHYPPPRITLWRSSYQIPKVWKSSGRVLYLIFYLFTIPIWFPADLSILLLGATDSVNYVIDFQENEKSKDMIIEPRIQQLLMAGRNGVPPPIRTIYENFPKVTVVWPNEGGNQQPHIENPTRSVVQLRGDRQQVDAAAERLVKLIKLVTEENQRQEVSSSNAYTHI